MDSSFGNSGPLGFPFILSLFYAVLNVCVPFPVCCLGQDVEFEGIGIFIYFDTLPNPTTRP